MRVTGAFSRLLSLPGVWVREVSFEPGRVVVTVVLRRRRLQCPKCSYLTWNRENKQRHDSTWGHLDLGTWRLEVHARLRRLRCPEHGVHVEGVPYARDGARFTRGGWLQAGEELEPAIFTRASRLTAVSMDMGAGITACGY
jgi:transposase